jgi:23S rRNA pseudouridine955/2504/2580 synthase
MLVEVTISVNDAGQRAERYLRRYLPELSSGRLQSLFRRKEVKVARKPVEQGYLLQAGDRLQVYGVREEEALREPSGPAQGTARNSAAKPAFPPPAILYEDFELLVVDKPAGVAAHPGSGILPGASLIARLPRRPAGLEKETPRGGRGRTGRRFPRGSVVRGLARGPGSRLGQ